MIRRLVFSLLLLAPLAVGAQLKAGVPVAGKDYVVLNPAQPTWGTGGIEVAEVFGYTCIHCAQFQPLVNNWKKSLPADVKLRYVPAAFGGIWDNGARAFFASEALKVQERTHDAVFKAVFIDKKVKTASVEEFADVYASLGVDRAKILSVMYSTTVSGKVNRARQVAQRAGVNSTPTITVNGKYRITAKSHEESLKVAEYLVAKERAALPAAPAKK